MRKDMGCVSCGEQDPAKIKVNVVKRNNIVIGLVFLCLACKEKTANVNMVVIRKPEVPTAKVANG